MDIIILEEQRLLRTHTILMDIGLQIQMEVMHIIAAVEKVALEQHQEHILIQVEAHGLKDLMDLGAVLEVVEVLPEEHIQEDIREAREVHTQAQVLLEVEHMVEVMILQETM